MIGRAGLLYAIGFGIILALIGNRLGHYATETEGTMAAFCDASLSHNIALAGANVALSKFYNDRTWSGTTAQTAGLPGMKGTFRATLSSGASSATLVSVSSYNAWWAHGGSISDTIRVSLAVNDNSNFAQYAWYTNFSGNDQFWYGNDTVWGPVRSNGGMHMMVGGMGGNIVFNGKVMLAKQIQGPGNPIYTQGPPVKTVGLAYPTDLAQISSAAVTGGKMYTGDVKITFNGGSGAGGDGSIIVRNPTTNALVDSFALATGGFNGAIWTTGNVTLPGGSGKVDGKVTIGTAGDIYIGGGGIRYEQDPLAGPSTSVLGLCAMNNIVIGKNATTMDAANWPSCRIDAAMFTVNGSFNANRPGSNFGNLMVVGSVAEGSKGEVMKGNGNEGYSKRYHWDSRFADPAYKPPFFPGFGPKTYQITNWYESSNRQVAYND